MIWLESVHFLNYKTHRDNIFHFHKESNSIMGPSDRGKTTILKGIKKLYLNKPYGTSFISWGEKVCTITCIQCNDKGGTLGDDELERLKVIRRISHGGISEISIEDMDGRVIETATKFGTSYPPEILRYFPFKAITLGYTSIVLNFADQFSEPFLIRRSPKEIGIAIGKLAGTEVLDIMYQDIGKDLKKERSVVDNDATGLEVQAENGRIALEAFDYIPEREKNLAEVSALHKSMMEIDASVNRIEAHRIGISNTSEDLSVAMETIKESENFEEIISIGSRLKRDWDNYQLYMRNKNKVISACDGISDAYSTVKKHSTGDRVIEIGDEMLELSNRNLPIAEMISKLGNASRGILKISENIISDEEVKALESLEPITEDAIAISKYLSKVSTYKRKIAGRVDTIESADEDVIRLRGRLEESVLDYTNALERLPDAHCPICRSDISGMDIAEISKEMFA